ncbi:MAG: aminoacyl-tRNA hydrolase [Anaerolineae bacterium]|nr:aminoacyl-tRNA hydrolase [Anaerolineae bacterium]
MAGSPEPVTALVVGLGNPGPEYRCTRHNVGFMVVERLAARWRLQWNRPRDQSRRAVGRVAERRIELMEPLTYMNLSGRPVARALARHGLSPSDLLLVHDDVDLPFGRLRLRPSGSAAGHRGVQSVIDALGTNEFPRLRVGIGRPNDEGVRDFVLSTFGPDERAQLEALLDRAVAAVETALGRGLEAAMNEFNRF